MTDLITRTNPGAEPRCVKFGYHGRKLAVGSDEMVVKVIDTRDTTKVQQLAGHEAAVRGLAWNPDGTLLVTSSCDGSMRVWDMSSDETLEPSCVKEIKDVIVGGDPRYTTCSEIHWYQAWLTSAGLQFHQELRSSVAPKWSILCGRQQDARYVAASFVECRYESAHTLLNS